jgi:hypothetical protein
VLVSRGGEGGRFESSCHFVELSNTTMSVTNPTFFFCSVFCLQDFSFLFSFLSKPLIFLTFYIFFFPALNLSKFATSSPSFWEIDLEPIPQGIFFFFLGVLGQAKTYIIRKHKRLRTKKARYLLLVDFLVSLFAFLMDYKKKKKKKCRECKMKERL